MEVPIIANIIILLQRDIVLGELVIGDGERREIGLDGCFDWIGDKVLDWKTEWYLDSSWRVHQEWLEQFVQHSNVTFKE